MSSFEMSPGIVCDDGTVLGRMSDVELFQAWDVQTDEIMLTPEIDGIGEKTPMFSQEKQEKIRKNNSGGRLWKILRKGQKQIASEREAERKRIVKHRVEVMTLAQELGVLIPLDEEGDD